MEATTEETIREFSTVKKLVREILESDIKTRNSDKWLIYKTLCSICQKYDKRIFIPFELFDMLPSYETITRCRRKLNEQGICLPTNPDVLKQRARKEKGVRQWARQDRGETA